MSLISPIDDQVDGDADEREYSARLGDVLGDSDEENESDNESEEGFLYDGADAEPVGPYREQLSEILEQGFDELDELEDEQHLEPEPDRNTPSPIAQLEPALVRYFY